VPFPDRVFVAVTTRSPCGNQITDHQDARVGGYGRTYRSLGRRLTPRNTGSWSLTTISRGPATPIDSDKEKPAPPIAALS
jgi:hypothetical protein